jgi:peptidoglycan/xylan/chitin deacetylase (PgdA/CDA1 family)
MKALADAGHEIGIYGYTHENPVTMTREQETEVLDKSIELVTKLIGKRPTGYVAPSWEFSAVADELLLERGIKCDHSSMHHDHQPYYLRTCRPGPARIAAPRSSSSYAGSVPL